MTKEIAKGTVANGDDYPGRTMHMNKHADMRRGGRKLAPIGTGRSAAAAPENHLRDGGSGARQPEDCCCREGDERGDGGWTFVETLLVIAIVLILTGAVGFVGFRTLDSAREAQARNQISTFRTALSTYMIHAGRYPTEAQGLDALWEAPVIEPVPSSWNGPYLSQPVPDDPWGNPYEYRVPGPDGLPFGIRSLGPGGDGAGSITSWSDE